MKDQKGIFVSNARQRITDIATRIKKLKIKVSVPSLCILIFFIFLILSPMLVVSLKIDNAKVHFFLHSANFLNYSFGYFNI